MKALLLLLLALPAPAMVDSICHPYPVDPAPEPSALVPKCHATGDTLYFDGVVDLYSLYEIKNHPNLKVLELNSGGGALRDIYEFVDIIRSRGIRTNVRRGARCASACTLLFMAGAERTAHPSAQFMFHGVRNGRGNFDEYIDGLCKSEGPAACERELARVGADFYGSTVQLFEAYVSLGASRELWTRYQSHEDDLDWYRKANFFKKKDWEMTAAEAQRLGVVQRLVGD